MGTPGTELFRSDLINTLSDLGILSLAYLPGQTLLEMLEVQRAAFLERLGQHAGNRLRPSPPWHRPRVGPGTV